MPSIYIGGKLTIEAMQDVTADVKTQKKIELFSIIGESVKQEYLGRVEAFKTKYEHAGIDGAYGAGLGLFVGAAGAGKLGVKVTTDSVKTLEKTTVKDLTTLGLPREQQAIIKNAERISIAKTRQATAPP